MDRYKLLRRLAPVCLLAALLVMTTATLAWMKTNEESNALYVALSDFEVEGKLFFGGTAYDHGNTILADVSLLPGAPNYIGDMKFQVEYTGVSPAYIRVRILEQWLDSSTDEVLSSNYLPYYLAGTATNLLVSGDTVLAGGTAAATEALANNGVWIDERPQDFCYYYSVPVRPHTLGATYQGSDGDRTLTDVQDGAVLLTLLDQTAPGASNAELLQGVDPDRMLLSLRFEVEAVQPNRFREFFGRETYPEPPAATP